MSEDLSESPSADGSPGGDHCKVDPEPLLISRLEVARLVGLSPASVDRYRRQNRFPKPITLGPNRIAYIRAEILAWIADRMAERDSDALMGRARDG